MSAKHQLEVYLDEDFLSRLADFRPVTAEDRAEAYAWRIVCSDPEACPAWVECEKDHAGYNPDDEDSVVFDCHEDEVLIHGVIHEWRWGYGWTVAYPGCPVAVADYDLPEGVSLDRPGFYPVDVDWDDDLCSVFLVER